MKKILLISNTVLQTDPRLINQLEAFKGSYYVYALGIGSFSGAYKCYDINKITRSFRFHYNYFYLIRKSFTLMFWVYKEFLALFRKRMIKNPHDRKYWKYINIRALKKIKNETFDIIWANDIDVLPMAVFLKADKTKLVFDAHEYFPFENSDSKWINENKNYRESLFLAAKPFINDMVTVSDSISKLFLNNYSISAKVIMNAKPYINIQPVNTKSNIIHIVHHGVALPNRNLEGIINLFSLLDERFYLHFYLKDSVFNILNKIKLQANNNPRIVFHETVDTNSIPIEISKYDIGIYLLQNVGINEENALPNKLFECIQARLMLIYPNLIEINKIVKNYNLGFTTDGNNLKDLAQKINNLSAEEIFYFKKNSDLAAKELSAEKEWEKMRSIAKELLVCVE